MDQRHYICDVLDYSTGTWCKCDDEIITKYSGYPMNVYDELGDEIWWTNFMKPMSWVMSYVMNAPKLAVHNKDIILNQNNK